jgi:hypothetical protein
MENGWVKLHRKLFENELWTAETFTKAQAWIDLFANANHKENTLWIRGNEVNIKRGQLGWSELTMVKRWRWSKNKVRRYLKWLETKQQIKQQKSQLTTIITILKYNEYQEDGLETKQQTIKQKDSRRYTNKNDKNEKEILSPLATEGDSMFKTKEYVDKLLADKKRHIHIIGLYYQFKELEFPALEAMRYSVKRDLKGARALNDYSDDKILEIMSKLQTKINQYKLEKWTLETVGKYINE